VPGLTTAIAGSNAKRVGGDPPFVHLPRRPASGRCFDAAAGWLLCDDKDRTSLLGPAQALAQGLPTEGTRAFLHGHLMPSEAGYDAKNCELDDRNGETVWVCYEKPCTPKAVAY